MHRQFDQLWAYLALGQRPGNAGQLGDRVRLLVRERAAERSGCRWCLDRARHDWRSAGLPVDLLTQLDRNLARKLYWTADFYRRTNELRGAAYTYRYLARAYPQTPEGQKATTAMTKLPQWAVAMAPEPAITPGFAPPSEPIQPPRLSPQPRINR